MKGSESSSGLLEIKINIYYRSIYKNGQPLGHIGIGITFKFVKWLEKMEHFKLEWLICFALYPFEVVSFSVN